MNCVKVFCIANKDGECCVDKCEGNITRFIPDEEKDTKELRARIYKIVRGNYMENITFGGLRFTSS